MIIRIIMIVIIIIVMISIMIMIMIMMIIIIIRPPLPPALVGRAAGPRLYSRKGEWHKRVGLYLLLMSSVPN